MKPKEKTIEEFQKAYFEEFRENISFQEAHDRFFRLVNFLRVVQKPLPEDDKNKENPDFPSDLDQ